MKIIFILLVFNISSLSSKVLHKSDDFLDFVRGFGYKAEAHEIETEDGYLLTVHRILPTTKKHQKFPVFLMHGIIATSGDYVVTGPEKALAFFLADNGFDVWLGNARGNKYSMNHRNFSSESPGFWNFSWHEIGFYDLPGMINYLLKITKALKTFYVGHSQGTTSSLVMLSTRPEYNDKIAQAHLLSPIAFMENFPQPILKILKPEIDKGALDAYTFLNLEPIWNVSVNFRDYFCADIELINEFFCPSLVLVTFFFFGFNKVGVEIDTVS